MLFILWSQLLIKLVTPDFIYAFLCDGEKRISNLCDEIDFMRLSKDSKYLSKTLDNLSWDEFWRLYDLTVLQKWSRITTGERKRIDEILSQQYVLLRFQLFAPSKKILFIFDFSLFIFHFSFFIFHVHFSFFIFFMTNPNQSRNHISCATLVSILSHRYIR